MIEAATRDGVNQLKSTRSFRIGALAVLICALAGLALFGVLAWQAVTVEDATRADAERRIAGVRAGLLSKGPLVEIDDEGRLVRGHRQATRLGVRSPGSGRSPGGRLTDGSCPWIRRSGSSS
jgi:hypothetical protein